MKKDLKSNLTDFLQMQFAFLNNRNLQQNQVKELQTKIWQMPLELLYWPKVRAHFLRVQAWMCFTECKLNKISEFSL